MTVERAPALGRVDSKSGAEPGRAAPESRRRGDEARFAGGTGDSGPTQLSRQLALALLPASSGLPAPSGALAATRDGVTGVHPSILEQPTQSEVLAHEAVHRDREADVGSPQRAQKPMPRVSRTTDTDEVQAERVADRLTSGARALGSTAPGTPSRTPLAFSLPSLPSSPASGASSLVRGLGPGSSLSQEVRAAMEPQLGYSLGAVQLHTGAGANDAMNTVHARAFALGEHIALGPGDAHPTSTTSWRLLAHELAHVVQPGPEPMIHRKGDGDVCEAETGEELSCEPVQDVPQTGVQTTAATPLPEPPPAEQVPRPDQTGTPGDTAADQALVTAHARQLRQVYLDEAAFVASINRSGPEISETLAGYDTEITQRLDSIRTLGVRLPAAQVVRRIFAGESLTELRPWLRYEPAQGPYRQGQALRFVVEVEYVPRIDPIRVTWTGELEGGAGAFPMVDPEARDTELVLDSTFWFLAVPFTLPGERKLTVAPSLSVGPKLITTPDLKVSLPIEPYRYDSEEPLHMTMRGGMMTGPATARALAGSTLSFSVSTGPPGEQYAMQWSWLNLDRNDPYPGMPFGRRHEASSVVELTLSDPGRYAVIARILPANNIFNRWMVQVDPGYAPPTAALQVQVGTLAEWGSYALSQLAAEKTPRPAVTELGERLDAEARENELLASRATSEDREHYEKAAEQRRKMASTLEDRIGAPVATVQPFPATEAGFGAGVHATAVPASLVIANSAATPGGGIQPLTLYLTMRRTGTGFSAVLIDATTKDMSPYPGTGGGSQEAADAAFQRWQERNPYPIEGLVVYRYVLPDKTILRGRFTTTTREKEIEKFIEDILTTGGYVVAVLLLLAPEATVTKALALGMLGLGVGYGVHRISRNVELGIGAFDSRNILEAIGILGSAVGIGGSALRSAGLRAARPLIARAGNWMVISTLATNVGTLTYVGYESYEMLRASASDPSLSDSARIALLARTAGQLLSQSVMIVVSVKDLLRGGLRRSDFFATRGPGLADLPTLEPTTGRPLVDLDPGSRIDLQAELVRRGATPAEVIKLSDTELLAQLHSVQQGAMRGPEVYQRTPVELAPPQREGVVQGARAHTAPGVTVEKTSSPTTLVMKVGGLPVEVRVRFEAPPSATGVHGARSGPGRVRVDYETTVKRWVAEVDVDPHLSERDAGLLLREELDEAGEIVRRLNARVTGRQPLRGGSLRRAIEGEQRASLARSAVSGETETAHDVSAFRALGRMYDEAQRTGSLEDWATLDRMLIELGFNPKLPISEVRVAAVGRALGTGADRLAAYIWGGGFKPPVIQVPSAATHDPLVVKQVRAYTDALADYRANRRGPAAARLTEIEQLAAAAHGATRLDVNALVREGMPREAAELIVADTGGANPYTHLYDVLFTSFELRRNLTTTQDFAGRRFTVIGADGHPRQPMAIEALNGRVDERGRLSLPGSQPELISFAEFMRRMDVTKVTPTVKRMGDEGAGWIQWEFTEPDGAGSRVRLDLPGVPVRPDLPGVKAQAGEQRGYFFEAAQNMHAGVTFTPAGESQSLPMSANGVEVLANMAGAHIRIVPDATMIPKLTALDVGPKGQRLSEVLRRRNL
jgi:hypothetical protein